MRASLELVVTERSYLYGIPFTHSSRVGLLCAATAYPMGPFSVPFPAPSPRVSPSFLPSLEREKRFFGSFSARWRVPEECSGSRVLNRRLVVSCKKPAWNRDRIIMSVLSRPRRFFALITCASCRSFNYETALNRHVRRFNHRCVTNVFEVV